MRLLAGIAIAAMLAPPARAQVVRNFAPRFSVNRTGGITLIGNTLLTCSPTGTNGADCANGRAGLGAHINNNDFTQMNVDVDGDPTTFNSSSATLTLPAGATVLWAGLYWGAELTASGGGTAAPDATQRGVVQLATPAAGYATVTASQVDLQGTTFQGFADVTAALQSGGNGVYTVANVQAGTGDNRHAGWSLVVVYQDITQPLRNLTVFDGYALVNGTNPAVSIPVTGFLTPAVGPVRTSVGFVTYEGDLGLIGDDARLNGTVLTDALNPAGNFFNSSISNLGARITAKNPDYVNQTGFDVDQVDATGLLANGATGATISVTTVGDTYYPGVITFATELFSPDLNGHIQKTVQDLNGANVEPGDTLEYTISLGNSGQDGANGVELIDTIPAGAIYVPGSMQVTAGVNPGPRTDAVADDQADFDAAGNRVVMRLGIGATNVAGGQLAPGASATVKFRVQVNPAAGNGTRISNIAAVIYQGQTLPTSFTSVSDGDPATVGAQATVVTVSRADMSVTKTHAGTFTQGGTGSYTVRVSNSGGAKTTAPVTLTDPLPPSLIATSATGTGWSCSIAANTVTCTRADQLAAGASYPDITIAVNIGFTAPATVTNVATVSGGGEVNLANDAASDPTAVAGTPDLSIIKAHATPFSVGGGGTYTISITNVGRGPTAGTITVVDDLPAGLTYVSATGTNFTCAAVAQVVTCTSSTSIAAGGAATITLTVLVSAAALPGVTNTAIVSVPGDLDTANNSASDPTTVAGVVDVSLTKTHSGTFTVGSSGVYTLTVSSVGTLPTTGPITLVDSLPVGLSYVAATGTGWSCADAAAVVTCTTNATLVPAQQSAVTLTVGVAAGAVPQVTNVAVVSTPGDAVAQNNRATDPTVVAGLVDVAIQKTHSGTFTVGRTATYLLAVSNVGSAATSGALTVSDTLAAGLAFTAGTGPGWSCNAAGQVVTCANPGPLAAAAQSTITVTVGVGLAALPSVSNTARVTTPGDTASGGNNVSTDAAVPVTGDFRLAVDKRASRTEAEIGDVVDYAITVRTLGVSQVPGVVVDDRLPPGFSYQPGSARAGGARIPDPTGGRGPQLEFAVGTLPADSVLALTYRVRIGAGASVGTSVNRAQAMSATAAAQSNIAAAAVRIVGGVFSDRGVIVGKVYTECGCGPRGEQGSEELGIPGVRIYLEDGTSTITDIEGKYDFYDVSPRLHVVHVDRTTLPAGATLVPIANRDAGDGYSRFVDMKNGELHKADFAEGSHSDDVHAAVLARRTHGEVNAAAPSTGMAPGMSLTLPPAGASAVDTGHRSSPVAPAPTGAASYQPLLPQRTLNEENSQLPPTPLRAAVQMGLVGLPLRSALQLVPSATSAPADGNSSTPVSVRLVDSTGAPITARTVVTLETTAGRWDVTDIDSVEPGVQTALVGGRAELSLIAALQPTTAIVRVTTGTLEVTQRINFLPVLRPLIAAGVVEGRLNLRSLTASALAPANPQDGFEEVLSDVSFSGNDGNVSGAARGALVLKGKVKGSYLLTLAYDSERDPEHGLFRDIQPDAFYPVYGDAAIKEFDAQSSDRLYVRVDKGRSFFLYGDYATPRAAETRQLSAYDRTLTGFEQHLENRRGAVDVFASQGRSRQVVDEIPGRGISGPYALSHQDGIANSERVEIITRDRNQPSLILSAVPQTRFADYTIEAFTGRLLFRVPVPSLDANLNPVVIRVTYEAESTGDAFWTYGIDAHARLLSGVELGATATRDDEPGARQQLLGLNSTVRVADGTFLMGEVAQTDNAGSHTADAERVELRHSSRRFEGRVYAAHSDSAFANTSSTFAGGRTELGARGTMMIDERTRLLGEVLRTEDAVTGGRRQGAQLSVERRVGERWKIEVGYRLAHETGVPADTSTFGATPNNTSAVRAKVTARVTARASLFGEYEQDVVETDQHRGALGGEYLFSQRGRLYARHEWITSFGGPYALNGLQHLQNTVVGMDADYLRNSQLFSEYRARDAFAGREAEAAIGLRNRWPVAPGLVLNTSFERVSPLRGDNSTEATAITGAIDYTGSPLWKGSARLEWRTAPSGDNLLGTLGYARKINRDLTFLGRSLFDDMGHGLWREHTQLGIAWRQTDSDRWNALARYEHSAEHADSSLGAPTRHDANIVSGLVNFQPSRRLTLSGRYAAKIADDKSDSLDTRSNAQLLLLRGMFDLTKTWDVGLITSVLVSDGFSSRRYGLGVEGGRILARNLRAALGFNIFGFRDQDLTAAGYTSRGVYVDLGFKFDETLFGGGANRRGPGETGGGPP